MPEADIVNPAPRRNLLLAGLRIVLGVVLFYAGFVKLTSAYEFAHTIANFRLLTGVLNQILAVVLPWWEVAAGLMLILGLWVRAAALLATLLFAAFGAAVSLALIRGLDIECGCFGTGSAARVGLLALSIDIAGLLASLAMAKFGDRETATFS